MTLSATKSQQKIVAICGRKGVEIKKKEITAVEIHSFGPSWRKLEFFFQKEYHDFFVAVAIGPIACLERNLQTSILLGENRRFS